MAEITYKQAGRRYRRIFIPIMALYAALCFGGPYLLFATGGTPPSWLAALVAIGTAAPIWVGFVLMWRYVRETDEFTRLRQLKAMTAGGMITASFCVLWGFLELYQVLPSFWVFMVGPIFFAAYGLSFWFQGRELGRDLQAQQ